MTNLNPSLTESQQKINKGFRALFIFLIIFSFLGFLDSAYLTFKHYQGTPLECAIFKGCDQVTNSPYSVIFGIPVALFGVIYYLAVFFLGIISLEFRRFETLKIIFPLAFAAFLASVYFLYLQIFVIRALCIYCLFSLATSTALFILSIILLKNGRNHSIFKK